MQTDGLLIAKKKWGKCTRVIQHRAREKQGELLANLIRSINEQAMNHSNLKFSIVQTLLAVCTFTLPTVCGSMHPCTVAVLVHICSALGWSGNTQSPCPSLPGFEQLDQQIVASVGLWVLVPTK